MEVAVYKNFRTRGKRPMRNLSLTDKVRAIQRIHDGETKASVSRDLGVPESTLRGWCKNEQKLRFMSTQSQLLEGLADNSADKRLADMNMNNLENTTNCFNTNFIKEENNNNSYKIPEFISNINLQKFNWNAPSEFSPMSFTPEANQLAALQTELTNGADNSHHLDIYQKSLAENHFEDLMSRNKACDPYSVMQWCQVFLNSVNFMAQTPVSTELNSTSSSTEPESTSMLSFVCNGKRTYDDPYSELRNIYEQQKGSESEDDSIDDDCGMHVDEQPQDLSIRSQT